LNEKPDKYLAGVADPTLFIRTGTAASLTWPFIRQEGLFPAACAHGFAVAWVVPYLRESNTQKPIATQSRIFLSAE
jgi:hypothetical protein